MIRLKARFATSEYTEEDIHGRWYRRSMGMPNTGCAQAECWTGKQLWDGYSDDSRARSSYVCSSIRRLRSAEVLCLGKCHQHSPSPLVATMLDEARSVI